MPNQVAHLPFSQGLNEQGAAALVGPDYVLSVQNLVQSNDDGWTKRNGFTNLGNGFAAGGTFTSPILRIARFRNAPFIIDGHNIIGYSAGANALTSQDRVPECVATRRTVMAARGIVGTFSMATNGTLTCIVFMADPALGGGTNSIFNFCVIDSATNEFVIRPQTLGALNAGLGKCRVVFCNGKFVLMASTNAGAFINTWVVDPANLSANVSATILAQCGTISPGTTWDACPISATRYAIAFKNNSGGANQGTISAFSPGSATVISTANWATTNTGAIGVACDITLGGAAVVWVGYAETVGPIVRCIGFGVGLATVGSVLTILNPPSTPLCVALTVTGSAAATLTAGNSVATGTAGSPTEGMQWAAIVITAGNVAIAFAARTCPRVRIMAKPFVKGSRVYLPVVHYFLGFPASTGRSLQPTCVLIDITSDATTIGDIYARPVATVAPRLIETLRNAGAPDICGDVTVSGTTVQWLTIVLKSAVGNGLELVTADFSTQNKWRSGELGASLLVTSGTPMSFDGVTSSEVGFITYPDMSGTVTAGPGITGTVYYSSIFEWISDAGELVRSPPSVPIGPFAPANQKITLTITGLPMSAKSDQARSDNKVRLVIYRTTLIGGTTYYRLPDQAFAPIHPIVDAVTTVTFVDSFADSAITGNEQLYRQVGVASTVPTGTVYARQNPPSATIGVVHNGRWWIVADDQTTIYYTGQQVSGEQPWFNDNFFVQVPDGGPITGLGSLDSALVIFKRDRIYVVDMGFGPGDDGSGNDIGQPQILSVDVGADDQRSIVRTPDGLMFRSPIGIYTLTRSRQVAYTGWKVQNRLKAFPYVQSATLIEAQGRVFFELSASDPPNVATQGLTLVWDYIGQLWSTDVRTADYFGAGAPALDGVTINGLYYWGDFAGVIHQETPGVYFDMDQGSGYWVTAQIETSWLKGSGFQGWMSAKRATFLVNKNAPCDLMVTAAYDYSASYTDTVRTFTSTQLAALTGSQVEKITKTDPCEAVRFKLTDAFATGGSSGTGQGLTFVGISFEFEALEGVYRLPAGAR